MVTRRRGATFAVLAAADMHGHRFPQWRIACLANTPQRNAVVKLLILRISRATAGTDALMESYQKLPAAI
jgi:hypothetical protein